MDYDNENADTSKMRQQSRLPSPGRLKLQILSSSASNARSAVMPPPIGSLKRKNQNDRAGEQSRTHPVPPVSRSNNANTKFGGISGPSRESSLPTSVSSVRPSPISTRNASFSSNSSVGSRSISGQSCRPQSAMSITRSQRPNSTLYRPSTSQEVHAMNSECQGVGQKKRRAQFLSTPKENFGKSSKHRRNESYDTQIDHTSSGESKSYSANVIRNISISTAFSGLSLHEKSQSTPIVDLEPPATPSQIPRPVLDSLTFPSPLESSSPTKSPKKHTPVTPFLNRNSNIRAAPAPAPAPWDTESRLFGMEKAYSHITQQLDSATNDIDSLKSSLTSYKAQAQELEVTRTQLLETNAALQSETDSSRSLLRTTTIALEDSKRSHSIQVDDLQRQHRHELEKAAHKAEDEIRRLVRDHSDEMSALKRRLENALEDEALRRQAAVHAVTSESALSQQKMESELGDLQKTVRGLENDLEASRADLSRERATNNDLRIKTADAASHSISLEVAMRSLRAQIDFLESDNKSQSHAFVDLETRLQNALRAAAETNDKLRKEETLRRKLHNQVQELKGNIRVFCRVRPSLESEPKNEAARIAYPDTGSDSKELEILGQEEKSSLGNVTTKKNAFTFDRVFTPDSINADVFEELSQLVQSALDGYNVCIFCYGQTGSGKTYTMSADDGMIPRAVRQIYDTAKSLEEKGWKYSMEGSFVEVYNENLNDLLGKPDDFDKKKHEIKHDMQKCKTTITDVTSVDLDTPDTVESILRQATSNRSVAATKANERSSRSHSVFILKLAGENSTTGERSEGTLNLVDLAGSERLGHSKATGERLKETQNINKSLSCLGDVIGALGQGKDGVHVPYRNSKLTYLLQFSLGGNSKTLMFVMISPLQAHLSETLTSLKFATKVHHTHIGTAKRQAKIRDL